jgi:outer membrane protein W
MGLGLFDNQASAKSCADKISNIMAANLGVGFKATDKLSFTFDVWYAKLAEEDAKKNDVLGTEIDLRMTYAVMKNLNLDLVAAYLFTGDATSGGVANDKDAYEVGAMLSFSF